MKKDLLASVIILGLFSVSAQAAPINQTLNDRLAFRIGPFFPSIDTSVQLGDQKQDFEDYLDDNATTAAIKGMWRISNHFRLNFGYWAVDRETSTDFDISVPIGPITIPARTTITASFDSSLASAAVGWSFIRNDTTEFGIDLGLSALSLKSALDASVAGISVASFTAFDETYPLPTVGVYFTKALSPKWSLEGRFSGIGLSLGQDFKGTIIDAMGGAEFRPWQNVGFGIAYVYNEADAKLKDVSDNLDIKWKYQGPFAYITFGFGEVN